MLEIKNLNLYINEKKLLEDFNLTINPGEIHVLMGRNGIGKSSIAKTIMGDKNYRVEGSIKYKDQDLTKLEIDERARLGIYILNQSPMAIEGVTNAEMLRLALSEKTNSSVDIFKFNKELENICESLELDKSFIHREINVGCSGGERKKIELLHMWVLKPSLIILDEIDSGLDVDACKIVAKSLKKYFEEYHPSIIIITHTDTLINNFEDYYVHLISNKKIIATGKKELAEDILTKGFKEILAEKNNSDTFVISEKE